MKEEKEVKGQITKEMGVDGAAKRKKGVKTTPFIWHLECSPRIHHWTSMDDNSFLCFHVASF